MQPSAPITRPWFLLITWLGSGFVGCALRIVGSVNHFHSPAGQALPAVALTLPIVVTVAPTFLWPSKRCHVAFCLGTLPITSIAVRVPSSVPAAPTLRSSEDTRPRACQAADALCISAFLWLWPRKETSGGSSSLTSWHVGLTVAVLRLLSLLEQYDLAALAFLLLVL